MTNTNGEEFNGKVAVTVKIEPLVDITREVAASRIQIQNVPEAIPSLWTRAAVYP